METERKRRIEFGDFQTPDDLAIAACKKLIEIGIAPDLVIEPTCGVGAFVVAAASQFPTAHEIRGFEVNAAYLEILKARLQILSVLPTVQAENANFFEVDWQSQLGTKDQYLLVLGNFPWVTSSAQGAIGGANLPEKSNFQNHKGFDAITGKANFDISEWMLLEVLRWFPNRTGAIAMLVKTAVARKVLSQAQQLGVNVLDAFMYGIDSKKHFGAAVDACLMVVRFTCNPVNPDHEYTVFKDFEATSGTRVGHRDGRTVGDLDAFDMTKHLVGASPQKWRSGVKHDASAVMELTRNNGVLSNGLDQIVTVENTYLFPLMKGSDVGSGKQWRQKFTLVTQRFVGEPTDAIRECAPLTWTYLMNHATQLDARGSSIYAKNPRFSIFGIGDYAFRPWKIAICALYKRLDFRLIGPIEGKPVMFDDTVYYISYDDREEAEQTLEKLNGDSARRLLGALIFWDEKRPIKTSILNLLDWKKIS